MFLFGLHVQLRYCVNLQMGRQQLCFRPGSLGAPGRAPASFLQEEVLGLELLKVVAAFDIP